MNRQYYAQRCRGGHNPLRVGVVAIGSTYYLQEPDFFGRFGGRAVCRAPWRVEAFLNGQVHASRRNAESGLWESVYFSGRSDTAIVRSLRDGSRREVAVRLLQLHDDMGLTQGTTACPTLPDLRFYRAGKSVPRAAVTRRSAA